MTDTKPDKEQGTGGWNWTGSWLLSSHKLKLSHSSYNAWDATPFFFTLVGLPRASLLFSWNLIPCFQFEFITVQSLFCPLHINPVTAHTSDSAPTNKNRSLILHSSIASITTREDGQTHDSYLTYSKHDYMRLVVDQRQKDNYYPD